MLDEDGYLFIGGRSDDTIIRGGGEHRTRRDRGSSRRAPPRGARLRGVRRRDPQWGQIIVAVVVPADGATPDPPDELRDYVRGPASRFPHPPDRVVFRDELPTSPTGKVLRRELVAEFSAAKS